MGALLTGLAVMGEDVHLRRFEVGDRAEAAAAAAVRFGGDATRDFADKRPGLPPPNSITAATLRCSDATTVKATGGCLGLG